MEARVSFHWHTVAWECMQRLCSRCASALTGTEEVCQPYTALSDVPGRSDNNILSINKLPRSKVSKPSETCTAVFKRLSLTLV